MLGETFFRRVSRAAHVKTVLICFIIWILFSEGSGIFTDQRIELDDVNIAGRTIVAGSNSIPPAAKDLKSRRVAHLAGADLDGPMFHPEVGVLAKVAPNLCGGSVVESPGSEAFFGVGPVFRNGVDLNKRRRVVRSALIEACP